MGKFQISLVRSIAQSFPIRRIGEVAEEAQSFYNGSGEIEHGQ